MVKPTLSNPFENPPNADPFHSEAFAHAQDIQQAADVRPYQEFYPIYSYAGGGYEPGVVNRILGNLRYGFFRTAQEYKGLPDQRAVYYEIDSPQLHMRNVGPEPPNISVVHAGAPLAPMNLNVGQG